MTGRAPWEILRDIVTPVPFYHNEAAWTAMLQEIDAKCFNRPEWKCGCGASNPEPSKICGFCDCERVYGEVRPAPPIRTPAMTKPEVLPMDPATRAATAWYGHSPDKAGKVRALAKAIRDAYSQGVIRPADGEQVQRAEAFVNSLKGRVLISDRELVTAELARELDRAKNDAKLYADVAGRVYWKSSIASAQEKTTMTNDEMRQMLEKAELARKDEALRKGAEWFEDYERQHRAKHTSDGEIKADINAERAAYLRQALKGPTMTNDNMPVNVEATIDDILELKESDIITLAVVGGYTIEVNTKGGLTIYPAEVKETEANFEFYVDGYTMASTGLIGEIQCRGPDGRTAIFKSRSLTEYLQRRIDFPNVYHETP